MVQTIITLNKEQDDFIKHLKIDWGLQTKAQTIERLINVYKQQQR